MQNQIIRHEFARRKTLKVQFRFNFAVKLLANRMNFVTGDDLFYGSFPLIVRNSLRIRLKFRCIWRQDGLRMAADGGESARRAPRREGGAGRFSGFRAV